ncbi:MAG TPA: OmpA family protein [Verrucomicrobiae bacterium]|nr:OmpA family protein [Verrucomicrobiae bacterium]
MKLTAINKLLVLALILSVAGTGCRKRPGSITRLPGHVGNNVPEPPPGQALPDNNNPLLKNDNPGGFAQTDPGVRSNWPRDHEIFKQDIVHFDFDSSTVKPSEISKVSAVADYLKNNQMTAVEVEGHCDERGTEEYNRSLGERRALALREKLIGLGIDPSRVDTVSYGKDRPADPGHDEAAWKQNRRGEFALETPPK